MKSSQPRIGLWGWYNSGKTAYLIALYRDIAIHKKQWRMYPTDDRSERFIENNACRFLPGGYLPGSTGTTEVHNYEFQMVKNAGLWGQRDYRLTVIDAQGRHISRPADTVGYFGALQQCQGIMCLIDPVFVKSGGVHRPVSYGDSGEPQSYLELLERLFRKIALAGLDEHRRLRANIAFCVSKIDLETHWQQRDENAIGKHCKEIIGEQAFQLIENHCAPGRRKFFAISAVGRYEAPIVSPSAARRTESRPNLEPAGDTSRIADIEQWQPYGLIRPIEWLFQRIEKDQAAGTGFSDFVRWSLTPKSRRNGKANR